MESQAHGLVGAAGRHGRRGRRPNRGRASRHTPRELLPQDHPAPLPQPRRRPAATTVQLPLPEPPQQDPANVMTLHAGGAVIDAANAVVSRIRQTRPRRPPRPIDLSKLHDDECVVAIDITHQNGAIVTLYHALVSPRYSNNGIPERMVELTSEPGDIDRYSWPEHTTNVGPARGHMESERTMPMIIRPHLDVPVPSKMWSLPVLSEEEYPNLGVTIILGKPFIEWFQRYQQHLALIEANNSFYVNTQVGNQPYQYDKALAAIPAQASESMIGNTHLIPSIGQGPGTYAHVSPTSFAGDSNTNPRLEVFPGGQTDSTSL